MYVTCPACHSQAKIIERRAKGKKKSMFTCQCANIHCSSTFELSLSIVGNVIKKTQEAA